jgi:hypothetical protein
MSHFLERLASSVIRPSAEQKLRPLTGSVFAPGIQPGAFEATQLPGFELEQSEAIPQQSSSPHRGQGASTPDAAGRESDPLLPPIRSRLEFSPGIESRINLSKPRPESREAQGASSGPSLEPDRSHSDQTRKEHEFTPLVKTQTVSQRSGNFSIENRSPISRVQPAASHAASLRSASSAPQPLSSARPFAGDRAQALRQPTREPDEIHIHIGRVEVAALAQPTVRQAPPAVPRKSINLDEYLRRSNGRAR